MLNFRPISQFAQNCQNACSLQLISQKTLFHLFRWFFTKLESTYQGKVLRQMDTSEGKNKELCSFIKGTMSAGGHAQ